MTKGLAIIGGFVVLVITVIVLIPAYRHYVIPAYDYMAQPPPNAGIPYSGIPGAEVFKPGQTAPECAAGLIRIGQLSQVQFEQIYGTGAKCALGIPVDYYCAKLDKRKTRCE